MNDQPSTTLILVGRIHKAYGLDGALSVSFEAFFLDFIPKLKALYVEEEGKHIPYFPATIDVNEDGAAVLQFDEIHTKEAAKHFSTLNLFADPNKLPGLLEASMVGHPFQDILGYTVFIDGNKEGIVEDVVDTPGQPLIVTIYRGKEMYLPYVEAHIEKMDEANKSIYFKLPENYLDTFGK